MPNVFCCFLKKTLGKSFFKIFLIHVLSMKKISAIGFDWGGVILQHIDGSFAHVAAEYLHVDHECFRRAYFLHNHMINKGAQSKAFDQATEMWQKILLELDRVDQLDAFMTFVQSRPKGDVSQEMIALIQQLKNQGWKLGLLSNASSEGAQRIRNHACLALFDVALFSAEMDCMKPEPEAFQKFTSALGVPSPELVFIDDSTYSLSTAEEIGYIPILFQNTSLLKDQLKALGISV
ncbi:MAG: HAD-superfamily hydrolase, subfamily IA, variant 3 [Candidatus Uhrbacteria bacterium GW2011_GWE2_46_68]|uniref:HAD-superfamily hydrolase, subfamily IA, variant 3 n=2 Tax=Candidatus Uhriibacteriota TaxID=1752732 RepID=A0A0G1T7L4_9BACT|nr:MAG: HAD-superfamily hydrolase, subfamily IA, variant 3 [Candidatus Uhrbacteria bacterium GW2011_GWF2_46_218]KKU41420.1 MAG: HAD-superfamily hydrolase, subfamily IA, variant 3 [Candidatus Uhrbacteria bacterium GW2011_GWE2_46_68]